MIEFTPSKSYLLQYYIYSALIGLFIYFILLLIKKFLHKVNVAFGIDFFLLSYLSFSFLGLTIGFTTGLSRVAVSDAIVPAILTFIGGINVYIFANDKIIKEIKDILFLSIAIFSITLMYAIEIGSSYRAIQEDFIRDREHWYQKDIENYKAVIDLQKKGLNVAIDTLNEQ